VKELAKVIEEMLRQKQMWRGYRQNLIIEDWGALAGREIAAVSRALQWRNKTLLVAVRDSTWAYHLSLLKPQLLKKVNEYAGERVVHDIFFQVGEIETNQ
jgi:predicted nucleic acid-binding Zn ribbon protein